MSNLVYQEKIKTLFWKNLQFYNTNKSEIINFCTSISCTVESEIFGWIVCPSDNHAFMLMLKYGNSE
jgi:hypothetical protein